MGDLMAPTDPGKPRGTCENCRARSRNAATVPTRTRDAAIEIRISQPSELVYLFDEYCPQCNRQYSEACSLSARTMAVFCGKDLTRPPTQLGSAHPRTNID